jgi:hypothetical protein
MSNGPRSTPPWVWIVSSAIFAVAIVSVALIVTVRGGDSSGPAGNQPAADAATGNPNVATQDATPPDATCPDVACPEVPEPEPCPECPTCSPAREAVVSVLLLTTDRTGPQTSVTRIIVREGNAWRSIFEATAEGPESPPAAPLTDFPLGDGMLARVKASPGIVGQVAVSGAEGMICQQYDKTLSCWVISSDTDQLGRKMTLIASLSML